mgnify:CR=1 FL=1
MQSNNKTKRLPRGIRNCNPGNIRISKTRYKGEVVPSQDVAFKQFQSMEYGYRAMFVLIHYYYKVLHLTTVRQIISRYAPENENNTNAYIRHVADAILRGPDSEIDISSMDEMVLMIAAMSKVENGVPANIDEVIAGWKLYRQDRN